MARAVVIVADSLGIGAMPDAASFGDEGSHTLKSCWETGLCHLPNLCRLGLGNVEGNSFLPQERVPLAAYGRMSERSAGKDTTVGHWELMGHVSKRPLPTYPEGFPASVLEQWERRVGRGALCNAPYSGTAVIERYGAEHLATGKLIVYTSADSVFQIAAHEEKVPLSELYRICRETRALLQGEHGVGRVIARPFRTDEKGRFYRTANRRDFSLACPSETLLDHLIRQGKEVLAVGKIEDIFASRGISESVHVASNAEGMEHAIALLERDFDGLLFVNLVDFDSRFGHRNDAAGYAKALNEWDRTLPVLLERIKREDLLILCADHGCDPATPSTDHSREYVPLLIYSPDLTPVPLGTVEGFDAVAATLSHFFFGTAAPFRGTDLYPMLKPQKGISI